MADDILSKAKQKYGFLNNNPVTVIYSNRDATSNPNGFYAETWNAGDDDYGYAKRPQEIPLDSNGIEIFKPDKFNEDDLAGEVMHIDGIARQASEKILSSLNPDQLESILADAGDYEESIKLGLDQSTAVRNAIDSMIRGYVVGQWPKESIDAIGLNDDQRQILDQLKDYVISGMSDQQQEEAGFNSAE